MTYRKPTITIALIILNLIVFIMIPPFAPDLFISNGETLYDGMTLIPANVESGAWITLITSMFLHGSIAHIACNMISLYYLGAMLENELGKIKYVILYFASGIAGGLLFSYIGVNFGDPYQGAVGASGAIFGLFGALGWWLVIHRKELADGAIRDWVIMLAINIAFGIAPGSGIANEAHIGGMICGIVLCMLFLLPDVLNKNNRNKRTPNRYA